MTRAKAKQSRWRKAEKENYGSRIFFTLYVPAPHSSRQSPRALVEARAEITQKVRAKIDELKEFMEALGGMVKYSNDIK